MEQIGIKFRLIFIPYVFISIATIGIYTFLHWVLFIRTPVFWMYQETLKFIVPMVLPGIPVLIWLRPRIKFLELKKNAAVKNPMVGFVMIAWIGMVVTNVIAQEYLITATGKLTILSNISQLNKLPPTKYYTVKNFYADKNLARFRSETAVTGKHNTNYEINIYIAVPLYDKNHIIKFYSYVISDPASALTSNNAALIINGKNAEKEALQRINPKSFSKVTFIKNRAAIFKYGDPTKPGIIVLETHPYKGADTLLVTDEDNRSYKPSAWLAISHHQTISNKLSYQEKEDYLKVFYKKCENNLKLIHLSNFIYLDKISHSRVRKNFTETIGDKPDNVFPIVFKPVYEPFEQRNGETLIWLVVSFAISGFVFFLMLLSKPLKNNIPGIGYF